MAIEPGPQFSGNNGDDDNFGISPEEESEMESRAQRGHLEDNKHPNLHLLNANEHVNSFVENFTSKYPKPDSFEHDGTLSLSSMFDFKDKMRMSAELSKVIPTLKGFHANWHDSMMQAANTSPAPEAIPLARAAHRHVEKFANDMANIYGVPSDDPKMWEINDFVKRHGEHIENYVKALKEYYGRSA